MGSNRPGIGSRGRAPGPKSIDPWKQKDRLPLLEGGLLGDLIYGDEPRLIDDITPLLAADDPAIEYLAGFRSLMAAPAL